MFSLSRRPHNKAMKAAIEKHGLGRANSARPLWQRYMPKERFLLLNSHRLPETPFASKTAAYGSGLLATCSS